MLSPALLAAVMARRSWLNVCDIAKYLVARLDLREHFVWRDPLALLSVLLLQCRNGIDQLLNQIASQRRHGDHRRSDAHELRTECTFLHFCYTDGEYVF